MSKPTWRYLASAALAICAGAAAFESLSLLLATTPFAVLVIALLLVAMILMLAGLHLARPLARGVVVLVVAMVFGGYGLNLAISGQHGPGIAFEPVAMALAKARVECEAGRCETADVRTAPGEALPARSLLKIRSLRTAGEGSCDVFSYIMPDNGAFSIQAEYGEYRRARSSARRYALGWLFDWAYPRVLVLEAGSGVCLPLQNAPAAVASQPTTH